MDMRLIDVGGCRLACRVLGDGAPPVVFETGSEDSSASLADVARQVAGFTTAVLYDRAGLGGSEAVPGPRTSADVARDLHTLLDRAGIARPRVFVGHSFGAIHLRVYAGRYQADVAGMVLIDPSHPDQTARELALLPPPAPEEPAALAARRQLLEDERERPAHNSEGIDVAASAAEARAADPLGATPLVVITAGLDEWEDGFPPNVARALEADWQAMQSETAALSTSGEQVIARASYHAVQETEPELIVAAVRRLVMRVRGA